MDQYCINLGYLLDNPSVITLENPAAHSIHWYVSLIVLFFCIGQEDATSIFIYLCRSVQFLFAIVC